MRKSKVKRNLREGKPSLFITIHLTDASLFELISSMAVDCIWMDMEHHAYSLETANKLIRASRVGDIDVMVRPAKWEYLQISRVLETGATGILYPRCDNAEEAATVVRWAKFFPVGRRGADGGNPDMPYLSLPLDEYIKTANEETFVGIQIEDQKALDNAEEMARVEGVDFIFLGPADFSILGGFAGDMNHPKLQNAIQRIAAVAGNTGKAWGMPVAGAEKAKEVIELGAKILTWSSDLSIVMRGLQQIQKSFTRLTKA
ncbi:MAG: aldolase [Spirochaetales bacterium]|nr:aldolase [Spirochaetales bacterium]